MNALILSINQDETLDARKSGKKGSALATLSRRGFRVPNFVVVTPQAFLHNLTAEQRQNWAQFSTCDSPLDAAVEEIQTFLLNVVMKDDFVAELTSATVDLGGDRQRTFAVRSSGIEEDGSCHSFAGQFDTFLNIRLEQLQYKILDVWRSAFSTRVIAYRKEQGYPWFNGMPAVLVQPMVNAEVSGVAFSVDPVSQDKNICVVEAVLGLGHGLVSGELEADCFRVDRKGALLDCVIQNKDQAFRLKETSSANLTTLDGIVGDTIELRSVEDEQARRPALSAIQYDAVSKLARKCERVFEVPQDIEWSIEKGRLYLLQSRDITTLKNQDTEPARLAKDSEMKPFVTLWDNSNISESYNGVTTPLTFSFARKAYEHVYLQFCRLMQVPKYKIEANASVFPRMIGLLNGRVYYNLLNWYQLLSLLPGYSVNSRFMEQMMGVKESIPAELRPESKAATYAEKFRDLVAFICTLLGLVFRYSQLEKDISSFYSRLNNALADDLNQKQDAQLNVAPKTGTSFPGFASAAARRSAAEASHSAASNARRYRQLEQKLLAHWDAPLVNDFFAMIFYGLLSSLCKKWCHDTDGTLHNALLAHQGGIISAEPAFRIRLLASLTANDARFVKALSSGNVAEAEKMIAQRPLFDKEYRSYLAKFGDRCLEELKLESKTINDDPSLLLCAIGQAALKQGSTSGGSQKDATTSQSKESNKHCEQAEALVAERLQTNSPKKQIFLWVLRNARARVRDRENLRFERTRLFGRVRRIFLEIGADLHVLEILKNPRDIFYLQVEEILSLMEGTSTSTSVQAIIEIRQKEFAGYKQLDESPTRIRTEDLVYSSLNVMATKSNCREIDRVAFSNSGERALAPPAGNPNEKIVKGIGCCPGVVRGRIRVVLDPQSATIQQGEILVAKRTDPGWIMLFPAAAALIVEHGSLLSHSAIVARELGLASIIAVSQATAIFKTGDYVELDGATGQIKILQRSSDGSSKLSA